MKNIAILTINDNLNTGNRLQNYATQIFLEKLGYKVETIQNIKNYYNGNYKYILKKNIKDLIKRISLNSKHQRYINFLKFNKNINWSKYFIDSKHIPIEINKKYDYFIVGSDQVWNYKFERATNVEFLTFADKQKRISFSASFGISDIPNKLKEYYAKNLNAMNKISVREERGKEIISELTNRKDVVVLLDPTMLISIEDWNKVIKRPKLLKKIPKRKYILNYFLGNLSSERKKEIERFANENGCSIINLLDKDDPFYKYGPSEFLYLEKNAFMICTDSFHSTVFAILFNKPFIVFDREDSNAKMNSRLETLLSKFKVEERWFKGKIEKSLLYANYNANEILESEREKAKKFIKEALQ